MATGQRIALRVSATLLAAAAMLMPIAAARADGCNLGDIINGLVNTIGSLTSGTCAAACSDGVGCAAAAGVAAGFGGLGASGNQKSVDDFCNQLNTAVGDIGAIGQWLAAAGISQDVTGTILNTLQGLGDPLSVVQCSCSLEQGVGQLGSDFGACLQDGLCTALNFGQPCTCTPPPPTLAYCGQSNANCNSVIVQNPTVNDPNLTDQQKACLGSGPQGQNTIVAGYDFPNQTIQNISPYPPAQQVTNSAGTLVTSSGNYCGGISYCFCPKPMVPTWTLDATENQLNPNNCSVCANNYPWAIFSCNCPAGTHPDPSGKTIGGNSVCLCDGTNQVADLSSEALFGMCPPPACPTGQVRLSGLGKCVTPCSDPTKGMTPDGACCDPYQISACGVCCQPGTTPNPVNGSCENNRGQIQ